MPYELSVGENELLLLQGTFFSTPNAVRGVVEALLKALSPKVFCIIASLGLDYRISFSYNNQWVTVKNIYAPIFQERFLSHLP